MDILCPGCQKKLQIADSFAGQMIQCPSCMTAFQAPSLPSAGFLPAPAPFNTPSEPVPASGNTFNLAPESPRPTSSQVPIATPVPESYSSAKPMKENTRSLTIALRKEVVTLIPSCGMVLLLFLSFFPWRHVDITTKINLWALAFTAEGHTVFLFYLLLLLLAALVLILVPLFDKNVLPTPDPLRPYLPWVPAIFAFLNLAAWFLFFSHYFYCTFVETWDPATVGMKLAFRLHTLIVVAAFLDYWLERRRRQNLPAPSFNMRW